MPRMKKPKALTLAQEAEAFGFELDNLLTTEFSAQLTAKSELKRAHDLIRRLRDRVVKSDSLIDGYALNRSNATRLRLAQDALVADSRTRFPQYRRRRAA
jgi:hypothetical protein